MTFAEKLRALDACPDAVAWAWCKTAEQAYIECKHGDWMAWLASKLFPRQRVVLALCDCVEPTLRYMPVGEERPLVAIETARKWALGQATIEQVRNAALAAAAAADATAGAVGGACAAARAAACAAAYAARADAGASAARAAVYAAVAAADATNADCAARAAVYAAAVHAFIDSLQHSADIMRQHFGLEEFLNAMEAV
jgi:hypothetical protein